MAFGDASDPFLIKQNDNRPQLDYTVQQGSGSAKTAVDMTSGALVVFNMRDAGSGSLIIDRGTAEFLTPLTAGVLRYTWSDPDTAVAGSYLGEFEVSFDDGGTLTAPSGSSYIHITIGDDIA